MTVSKEGRDRIELYAKAGKSENYILDKVKKDEKEASAKALEELAHQALEKYKRRNASELEMLASPILVIAIVVVLGIAVFVFFVNNSEFVGKDCNGNEKTIKVSASLDLREQVVSALQFMQQKDCAAFSYVAENSPQINIEKNGKPTDARVSGAEFVDLYTVAPNNGIWMTRLLVDACLKEDESNTGMDCYEKAKARVEDLNVWT
ncbi:MAG: hypothetical protein V1847_04260 [Candidatus Diapherotrites archaeon]